MSPLSRRTYVGTSGWSLARSVAPGSSPELTGLERYAEYFNAVEINSTFYRSPRPSTLERWRDSTPAGFRFAAKLPRVLTHEAALEVSAREVREFCQLMGRLEPKLGPLLVQLPPSLSFDAALARRLFTQLARAGAGQVVLEPRHPSWFSAQTEELLIRHRVARAAADPARGGDPLQPAGCKDFAYFRWHGSPRRYFSSYSPEALAALARQIRRLGAARSRADLYCFFDNTALGAAAINALSLKAELAAQQR
ncbi:MAG TPA: DUF72 domain-containing protein [Polyangiaceae bacterium]|nr:DUF72 domain-containing protein [Polyangiaceae bacterium]